MEGGVTKDAETAAVWKAHRQGHTGIDRATKEFK